MSFVSLFHNKKKSESVVLIDINADSVAGAYAHYRDGELPVILYTRRFPVEAREGEPQERAMLRALAVLGDTLIREGAPILSRATGSGSNDAILVSIDAPWQKTSARTEHLEQETPFVFTKDLTATMLEKTRTIAPEELLVDESIIGTILNGYETREPYGRKAHRADIIVLTSLIEESVARDVISIFRGVYHTKHITPIAGSSLRYLAIQEAFPHENDALILDVAGSTVLIALVRKGLLVAIAEASGVDTADVLTQNVKNELIELAKQYPLPRTIFLIARESEVAALRQTINIANLGKLWLSDNPLKIVFVLSSHIVGFVRQTNAAQPDLHLLLMALYYQHCVREKT